MEHEQQRFDTRPQPQEGASRSIKDFFIAMSARKICAQYARKNFHVAVPTNPRDHQDYQAMYMISWLVLLVGVICMGSWIATGIGAMAWIASIASIYLLDVYVELPHDSDASQWQHDNYGFATRCAHWGPIASTISLGMFAPFLCTAAFTVWSVGAYAIRMLS